MNLLFHVQVHLYIIFNRFKSYFENEGQIQPATKKKTLRISLII